MRVNLQTQKVEKMVLFCSVQKAFDTKRNTRILRGPSSTVTLSKNKYYSFGLIFNCFIADLNPESLKVMEL